MTIRYTDGHTVEAALLSHTGNSMRLAINGSDDAAEFQQGHGTWVSEDGEPVTIQFAWDKITWRMHLFSERKIAFVRRNWPRGYCGCFFPARTANMKTCPFPTSATVSPIHCGIV